MLNHGVIPWGLNPEDYFKIEDPDFASAMRMKNGIMYHELVQAYLDSSKCEIKKEYYYEPFVVVGKVDFLHDDYVVEIKTSETMMKKSKAWHDHQAKLYCTMFDRPFGVIMQPTITQDKEGKDAGLVLQEIGRVERDDEWFDLEMQKLKNYHERLVLISEDHAIHP